MSRVLGVPGEGFFGRRKKGLHDGAAAAGGAYSGGKES